ncbi:MAG: hypothetical protein WA814_02920 [Candidatus Baltobacteraceae bacterium]
MHTSGLSRHALTCCITAALLAGCGESQPPISAPGTMPLARGAPPDVRGIYRGTYTETKDGKTLKGKVKIIVREIRAKISGKFDIRGNDNPFNADFSGRAEQSSHGAELHFTIVDLGGYDLNAEAHALVTHDRLTGKARAGRSGSSQTSYWKFEAIRSRGTSQP